MKGKNTKFLALYNSRWVTSYGKSAWSSVVWTQAFTGGKNKLPNNTEIIDAVLVNDETSIHIWLEPTTRNAGKKHRAFVMCDKCDCRVPAGRIHQHKC